MSLIRLNVIARNNIPRNGAVWVFDTEDISTPIIIGQRGGSILMIREGGKQYRGIKDTNDQFLATYEVLQTIQNICSVSSDIIALHVVEMDNEVQSGALRGFPVKLIVSPIEPVREGSMFNNQERGLHRLVNYKVSEKPYVLAGPDRKLFENGNEFIFQTGDPYLFE